MRMLHSLADVAELPCPVRWALGFFDGVHLGHRRVITAPAPAGAPLGVLTFEQHPLTLVAPQRAPKLLTPCTAQKAALLEALGVSYLLTLPFDAALAALTPQAFLDALCATQRVAGFSVGSNWHFGKGGAGNAAFLQQYAAAHGLPAVVSELAEQGGEAVCSSRIRTVLAGGDMESVSALLGHPFSIGGTVEQGQHLARTLGFPTANMAVSEQAALPSFGVYRAQACIGGRMVRGVASLGIRPTIQEAVKIVRLETHFLDFAGDLYGQELNVELLHFLRPEVTFDSVEQLRAQIAADVAAARAE